MPNYLLEIGTEELPAGYIPEAENRLEQLMSEALKSANLPFQSVQTLSTPRRLTIIVNGLDAKQQTTTKTEKGPPADKCFDDHGAPTKAAIGFAGKFGIAVDKLQREEQKGVTYVVAVVTTEGKPAEEVLAELAPKIIMQLTGERPMRWGSSDLKFSRPIRWLVSLLDDKIVSFKLEGLTAGRTSMGHRILAPGTIEIGKPDEYVGKLKAAKVLVEPMARKELIEKQVAQLAGNLNGKARQLSGPLLEEVVHITEWPRAVVGDFASEYLDLPDTLIETIMVHHQRYFPVEKKESQSNGNEHSIHRKSLLPHFITIANNDLEDAQKEIKQGNERVLKARLADGRFFYFDDQKTKFLDRKSALEHLQFQEGLGSYATKLERLAALSALLVRSLNLDVKYAKPLETAVELCKLDLVTNLVRELPELQGYVGAWYAEKEGQPQEVVQAISSHYAPRHTDDSIPSDTVGQLISVVDKIDHLVGLFALGKRPSGSSDPFALRRQAQGIIDVAIDGLTNYPVNLTELIDAELAAFEPSLKNSKKGFDAGKIKAELNEFLIQRLKGKLLDLQISRDIVEAVLSSRDPLANLPDVVVRCRSLEKLLTADGGMDVVKAGVRVGNILGENSPSTVNESALELDAEKALWAAFKKFRDQWQGSQSEFKMPVSERDYEALLAALKPLAKPVDDFFDNVMVNDENKTKRDNRHGILANIDQYFNSLADFTKFKSLLL